MGRVLPEFILYQTCNNIPQKTTVSNPGLLVEFIGKKCKFNVSIFYGYVL